MTPTLPSSPVRARWRSPAKVNLCLRVVGRRPDGYHLLDSIFVPVDLCDHVTLEVDDAGPGRATTIDVRCDHPGVPSGDDNLAARAVRALLADRGWGARVRCVIAKTIPPGAGLGGGSANAATVLLAMDALLGLALPSAHLREIALALGADVPFFLGGGPARVRGIGEDVEPIAGWPDLRLVIAIPPIAVATRWAFRTFAEHGRGHAGEEAARLAAGTAPNQRLLVNDLEQVVLPAFPAIAALKERILRAGAAAAVMSGSGSAVVGVASSAGAAEEIAATLRRTTPDLRVYAVGVLGRDAIRPDDAGPA
jgi:4-diphosphocytidyl-2-C-methyl-D-erythritol kinase